MSDDDRPATAEWIDGYAKGREDESAALRKRIEELEREVERLQFALAEAQS